MIRIISFIMLAYFLGVSAGCVTISKMERNKRFYKGEWSEAQPGIIALFKRKGTNEAVVIDEFGKPNKTQEIIGFRILGWSYKLCNSSDINITPYQKIDIECPEYLVVVKLDIVTGKVVDYETGHDWEEKSERSWSTTPFVTAGINAYIEKETLSSVMNNVAGRVERKIAQVGDSIEDTVESAKKTIEEGIDNVNDAIQE